MALKYVPLVLDESSSYVCDAVVTASIPYFPHTYLVAIYSPPSEKSSVTPKYSAPGIRCVGGVADG